MYSVPLTMLTSCAMVLITGCGGNTREKMESVQEIVKTRSLAVVLMDELKSFGRENGRYPQKLDELALPNDHDFYSLGGSEEDLARFSYSREASSCKLMWENERGKFGFVLDADGKMKVIPMSTQR